MMKRAVKTTLFFLSASLFLLSPALLHGQRVTIYGTVTDSVGNTITGATLYLPDLNQGTITGVDGKFSLTFDPGQREQIRATISCIGYFPDSVTLTRGDLITDLRVVLLPAVITLPDAVVTSSRNESVTMMTIPVPAGAVLPSVSGSVESAIATLPGVASYNELSSGFSVRGGSYDENLIYINGVETYRPGLIRAGRQEGLSSINPDLVASVNFSPGGFDVFYGDRMSSVLDINYREPEEMEGSLSLSLITSSAHLGMKSNDARAWFIAGVRYRSNALLLGSLDERGTYKPGFADIQAFSGYKINERTRLTLMLWGSSNSYTFIPRSRETTFGTITDAYRLYTFFEGGEHDSYNSMGGSLSFEKKHRSNLNSKLIISAYRAGENENYDIRGAYSLSSLDKSEGSENNPDTLLNAGVGSWLSHARNTLRSTMAGISYRGTASYRQNGIEWGAAVRYQSHRSRQNEWLRTDSAGYTRHTDMGGSMVNMNSRQESNVNRALAEGWLSGRTDFFIAAIKWTLKAGIRSAYDTWNSEVLFSPRLSLNAALTETLSAYMATGSYHQPPGGREFMVENLTSGVALKAQRSYHLTTGVRYDFIAWERPFRFTAEAWGKRFDRLIPYTVDNIRIIHYDGNSAKGYSTGLDMRVNGEFVSGVESWFSISLLKSVMEIPSQSTGLFPAPFDQRINFSIFFQDYLPGHPDFKAHINIAFGTGIPTSPPGKEQWESHFRIPPYRRIDIGFTKVLFSTPLSEKEWLIKELIAGVEIFNLADIRNTISYTWIQTVRNSLGETREYAVPNYLTRRSLNLKLTAHF